MSPISQSDHQVTAVCSWARMCWFSTSWSSDNDVVAASFMTSSLTSSSSSATSRAGSASSVFTYSRHNYNCALCLYTWHRMQQVITETFFPANLTDSQSHIAWHLPICTSAIPHNQAQNLSRVYSDGFVSTAFQIYHRLYITTQAVNHHSRGRGGKQPIFLYFLNRFVKTSSVTLWFWWGDCPDQLHWPQLHARTMLHNQLNNCNAVQLREYWLHVSTHWNAIRLPVYSICSATYNIRDKLLLLHPFNGLFSRTTWGSWHQKAEPFWILTTQEMTGWQ